jgi:TPR repeat protein
VEKSDSLAIKWYRMVAEQGHSASQSRLANEYFRGRGVPQSYSLVVEWFRKAAVQGNYTAQCNSTARVTTTVWVCSKSDSLAIEWYRRPFKDLT